MPTARQVKALIRSHVDGNEEQFNSVALQLAAQEARQGHAQFAQELKALVEESQKKAGQQPVLSRQKSIPIVQPQGELASLLSVGYPAVRISTMVLEKSVREKIDRVLLEQRQRERLAHHGFHPARKLLLVGPPGTGKTLTATVFAGELGLPLFTIQLDGLITKFLGETAAKLRLVFDALKRSRAVYLFDEFDALGGERGAANEVGEIRRVLNSFLQFLEQDDSESILVAATNHPALLDRALFRRFDLRINYKLPDTELGAKVIKNRLAMLGTTGVKWPSVKGATEGLSHADLVRASDQAAKIAILEGRKTVNTSDLLTSLAERRSGHGMSS